MTQLDREESRLARQLQECRSKLNTVRQNMQVYSAARVSFLIFSHLSCLFGQFRLLSLQFSLSPPARANQLI